MVAAAVATIALIVAALWTWAHAWQIADLASRPLVAVWAARCGAVALAAAAQVLLLSLVVSVIYRRGLVDQMLRLAAALTCTLAVVGAAALALAGR
jgi:hypothetical protein